MSMLLIVDKTFIIKKYGHYKIMADIKYAISFGLNYARMLITIKNQ